jgi:hypothetical protein
MNRESVPYPGAGKGTRFCRRRKEMETSNLILYLVVPLIFITVKPGQPVGETVDEGQEERPAEKCTGTG